MHMISNIRIDNFKSIKKAEFTFTEYTPLVGYNNAGKTNILRALEWILKKSSLAVTDYYDKGKPVSVSAKITGITAEVLDTLADKHRDRIEPLICDGKLTIRRVQNEPNAPVRQISFEVLDENEGKDVWKPNPGGIDAAIASLFPDPIFIGAMENATEDVGKFATSTTIGKLLKEIIDPINERHAASVNEALEVVAKKLSAFSDEKDEDLVALDENIQIELQKFFPGVSARTHIPTPEFSDFVKGATIRLFEDGYDNEEGRNASSFGHGAQRSVQIALLKCLSDIKRNSSGDHARTTLLLIDEPELYLHPQAIEMVRASLRRLSQEGYQVAFNTHSANMISRNDAPNVLLIRRNKDCGTYAFPRLYDAVQSAIDDAQHQSETLFSLSNSSKFLFSEKVILAEGKTEQAVLPDLFNAVRSKTLDEDKLALVSLGGSGDVVNAMSVLNAMGIPTKAIVDLDFVFRNAINHGLIAADHESIKGCKDILVRLKDQGKIALDLNGLPMKHNGLSAAASMELLASEKDAVPHIQNLHDELVKNGIWCWKEGAIEKTLDLPSKSPAVHMSFVNSLNEKGFIENLSGYRDIISLCDWSVT